MTEKKNPKIADNTLTSSLSLKENDRRRQVLQQLQTILSSAEFYATEHQKNFLIFVVEESLAGNSDQLKGYTVATQVFGRSQDFDSQTDPIVSIQANKLRRALEHYYLVDGKQDPVLIDIPKGTYVPVFTERKAFDHKSDKPEKILNQSVEEKWPTLLILPFKNRTGDPEKDFQCIGIAAELASEISCFQNMKVLFPVDGVPFDSEHDQHQAARFMLTGEVLPTFNGIKISARLTEAKSGQYLWGDTFTGDLDVSELQDFQDSIVKIVAAKVSGDFGIILRLVSSESHETPTAQLGTYEAILRFAEYEQRISPETFKRSLDSLTIAKTNDPHYGRVWTLLGRHYGTIHGLDIPGFENPLEKAVEYSEKGALLDPHCQRAVGSLAMIRFYSDELSIAINEVDRALSLNPNSLFILDGLAYILILSGDWERGARIAEKVIRINPYHRVVLHDALWVNYVRQGKYSQAYHEAMHGKRQWLFWDPLIKGSTLGLLGKEKEGQQYAQNLLNIRPDFVEKGRKLIRNYIKFEDIAIRIEKGLEKVGLELA